MTDSQTKERAATMEKIVALVQTTRVLSFPVRKSTVVWPTPGITVRSGSNSRTTSKRTGGERLSTAGAISSGSTPGS